MNDLESALRLLSLTARPEPPPSRLSPRRTHPRLEPGEPLRARIADLEENLHAKDEEIATLHRHVAENGARFNALFENHIEALVTMAETEAEIATKNGASRKAARANETRSKAEAMLKEFRRKRSESRGRR